MDNIELLQTSEYDFLRENKYLGDNICLLALGGSKAYGTNIETSDTDIRGIAVNPSSQIYGVDKDFEQIVDKDTDTTIYSLNKMVRLLVNCNPNTLEILGCRPQDYLYINKYGQAILDNKEAFLSTRAIETFGGYAIAQLNRLQNALLANGSNDSMRMQMAKNSLDCTIRGFNNNHMNNQINLQIDIIKKEENRLLWDSIKHSEKSDELEEDLVITGSFKQYPLSQFKSIISSIHKCQSEFGKLNKRNSKKTPEGLAKHMMHLIRLFIMGAEINETGKIVTYREKEHDLLMEIRKGKYLCDDGTRVRAEFYELAHEKQEAYKYSIHNTVLKEEPDYDRINHMLFNIYSDRYKVS